MLFYTGYGSNPCLHCLCACIALAGNSSQTPAEALDVGLWGLPWTAHTSAHAPSPVRSSPCLQRMEEDCTPLQRPQHDSDTGDCEAY
jgi:hypothetical protein